MPKKTSILLQKVSNLLKTSILLAKMRKPTIPKLVFLEKLKSSKLKKLSHVKHKHYNSGYIREYEFSPSNTPVAHHYRKSIKKEKYRDFYSIFFLGKCLGELKSKGADRNHYSYPLKFMALPAIENEAVAGSGVLELSDSGDERDSVDERAERFIEKFYQEMRMQRHESLLPQLNGFIDV